MSCHVVNNLLVNNDGIYHQHNARGEAGRGGSDVIVVGRTHSARLWEDKDWSVDNTNALLYSSVSELIFLGPEEEEKKGAFF